MLVYFDPWLAGVVLPTLIIVGLMAIPYIDTNPKGNGYYSFRERKWEIGVFLYGFLVLWSFLIITGTFLRGPNWNFFGPYEYWDPNKLVPLVNVDLSELIWVKALAMPLPKLWMIREIFGIALVVGYLGLPPLLAIGPFRRFYLKMGAAALLRRRVPLPDHDVAADQDGPALAVQSEVHRAHPGDLLQHVLRDAVEPMKPQEPIPHNYCDEQAERDLRAVESRAAGGHGPDRRLRLHPRLEVVPARVHAHAAGAHRVQELQVGEAEENKTQLADLDAQVKAQEQSTIARHRDAVRRRAEGARRVGREALRAPTRTTASPRRTSTPSATTPKRPSCSTAPTRRSSRPNTSGRTQHVDDLQAAPAGSDAPAATPRKARRRSLAEARSRTPRTRRKS